MDLILKDKVVMVAAGTKGLGFGIARALAREDFDEDPGCLWRLDSGFCLPWKWAALYAS